MSIKWSLESVGQTTFTKAEFGKTKNANQFQAMLQASLELAEIVEILTKIAISNHVIIISIASLALFSWKSAQFAIPKLGKWKKFIRTDITTLFKNKFLLLILKVIMFFMKHLLISEGSLSNNSHIQC